MKNCTQYRTEIEEKGEGLSAEARAHLQSCARCREFYQEQTDVVRLVGELSRVSAPNDFEFRLRARLAAAESAGRPRSLLRRSLVPGAASITLAAVFAVAIALTLQPGRKTETGQPQARVGEAPALAPKIEVTTPDQPVVETKQTLAANENENQNGDARISGAAGARRPAAATAKQTAVAQRQGKGKMMTVDFSVSKAAQIGAPDSSPTEIARTDVPIAVPLQTSHQPLKVVLRDERGTPRVVPMKRVSFGSQQLIGQLNGKTPDALASKEGVW
jgi:hypothetical protein